MGDPYKKFAKETYDTVYTAMKDGVAQSGNLPLLFMSGESHIDTKLEKQSNNFVPESDQEPAIAAAYTHVAAIKSAADLVGNDKVAISFEMDQETLDQLKDRYAHNPDSFQEMCERFPMLIALKYAIDNGYETVASDPLYQTPNATSPERFDAEKDALGKVALRTNNQPNIIVHIGGSYHIGYLQGHTNEELMENGEHLTRQENEDPFNGIFGHSVFINSAHRNPLQLQAAPDTQRYLYLQNPENAIQIDAPGKMDKADITDIAERIEAAAKDMTIRENIKANEELSLNDTASAASPFHGIGHK